MNIEHAIAYAFQDSLFPEIIECFGLEKAIQFVKIFGGTTIEVPSADQIQGAIRDFDVYQRLKIHPLDSADFTTDVKKLSNEYLLTTQEVTDIFSNMTQLSTSQIAEKVRGWKSRKAKPRAA